jgi:hypothetical protein
MFYLTLESYPVTILIQLDLSNQQIERKQFPDAIAKRANPTLEIWGKAVRVIKPFRCKEL